MLFPNITNLFCDLTGKILIQTEAVEYYEKTLSSIMDQRLKDSDAKYVSYFWRNLIRSTK